jgi:hypothetical protein
LSKSSWVDQIGVVGVDAAGVAAPALTKGAVTRPAITTRTPAIAAGIGIGNFRGRRPPADGSGPGTDCCAWTGLDLFLNIIALRLS